MSEQVQRIPVFVASPSDVVDERKRLVLVIDELNRTVAKDRGLVLELLRWETHTTPDMGRPQEIVIRQIGQYDVFIGIMWKHFGSPTGRKESGTEEEFNLAYSRWGNTGKPRIMFYFNEAPYTLKSEEEADQVRKLLEFRSKLERKGLICQYDGPEDFERKVREHLTHIIQEMNKKAVRASSVPEVIQKIPTKKPKQATFQQVYLFAYDSWSGMGKGSKTAEAFANLWMERYADKNFEVFKRVYEFAYDSWSGMGKSRQGAEKFALEQLSRKPNNTEPSQ